ncbi:MAG: hypothetical protein IPO81_27560 [Kouleothrix sp.]|nr:hypothetical protein [Kouleothrix sp.]
MAGSRPDPLQGLRAKEIKQPQDVGAPPVTMTCANCRLQFTDCVTHFGLDVQVKGLSAMVADALIEE